MNANTLSAISDVSTTFCIAQVCKQTDRSEAVTDQIVVFLGRADMNGECALHEALRQVQEAVHVMGKRYFVIVLVSTFPAHMGIKADSTVQFFCIEGMQSPL